MKEILRKAKFIISFARFSLLLVDDCWWDFQRALMDESVFLCRYHSTMVLHTHISPGG
jgi:hypothetical protein